MYQIRYKNERGKTKTHWLDSSHTFSFADYYDPAFMGFSDLRVINDDYLAPGGGFANHPHRDMEIISVVLEGELEHKDSMGNGTVIKVGEIQKMSAGTGVIHSEYNPSGLELTRFLQIWVLPDRQGLEPSYQQKAFPMEGMMNTFRLVVSPDGRENSIVISQDMELYEAKLQQGAAVKTEISAQRKYWMHVASGKVSVNGEDLEGGDGMGIVAEANVLEFAGLDNLSTVLLFNLK